MLNRSAMLAALALSASLSPPGLALAQTAAPYAVTGHIAIPDGGFDYASFDPAHRRVYLSRVGGVTALDIDRKTVVAHLADALHAHEVLPLNDGGQLLITDSGSSSAHLVNAMTGKRLAEIATGQKPDSALYEPVTGMALVIDGHGGDLTVIDPKLQAAVGRIAVGGGLEFGVADGTGRVFDNVEDQNRIAVIDAKARAVTASYPLKGCQGPTGLAYASDAGVLIAACANKVAKVIRASDGADLATLTIGAGPDAVIYDAARHLAFIPCGRDGVLEVIAVRGASDVAVIQTLATQQGARTGALDPLSGALYLPTAHFVTPPGGGKPVATPGSFEFLVVGPVAAN